jgi:hypothetical protein
MGNHHPDWSNMIDEELANWISKPCCDIQARNFGLFEEIAKRLAAQRERETSVDDAGLTVRQVIETLVRERDAAVAAAQREVKTVTDEMLNAMLTARWKAINPHTDWVPDWDKRDRLGMRAAFEAALGEKS